MKELRLRRGLKQVDVAKALNISKMTYSNYENNKRQADYKTLLKLAEFYNVSIDYLINTEKETKKFINIKISLEDIIKLSEITKNLESQIKIENTNLIKGDNNLINIENSYNKNKKDE